MLQDIRQIRRAASGVSEILLTIHEGRFHQVKRMMEAVGKKVIYLEKNFYGFSDFADDLPKGQARELTEEELAALGRWHLITFAEWLFYRNLGILC